MRKIKAYALLLCIAGTLLITAGTVLARLYPVTPTSDPISSGTLYFSNVHELVVITGTLPVTVEKTDGDVCEVSYISELPLIAAIDELGVLRLTQNDRFSLALLSYRRHSLGVTVKLPEREYRRVSLSTSSGDIRCCALSCDTFEASTRGGAITLPSVKSSSKIRTENGRIEMGLSQLDSDMTINAGAGNVTLTMPPDASYFVKYLTKSGCYTDPNTGELHRGDGAFIRGTPDYEITVNTTKGDFLLIQLPDEPLRQQYQQRVEINDISYNPVLQ